MSGTIDIPDLQTFVAVARSGSFVAASRRTGIPKSSVSRAVQRLEERVGARLLQRTSRRVTLTHEGQQLLTRSGALLDELTDVLDGMTDREEEPAGPLRITAPIVTGAGRIGRALVAFAAAHPRVQLELHLSNAIVDLVEEGFDLAFRGGPVMGSDLVIRKLWSVPFVLAATRKVTKRVLGKKKRLGADALAAAPAIVTNSIAAWSFRRADGTMNVVRPREAFATNDPRVAIEAARAGLGIVRAPRESVERAAELVILDTSLGEVEPREMFAVYPSRRLLPSRVRAAIDWVAASKDDG